MHRIFARPRPDSWLVCCPFCCVTNDVMNDNMAAFAHFGARLGAFFYWTRFLENNYRSTIYHSNLSYQSALEISVRIRVRLRVALFLANWFHAPISNSMRRTLNKRSSGFLRLGFQTCSTICLWIHSSPLPLLPLLFPVPQCFDTVGWVIWPVKTRPRYDL